MDNRYRTFLKIIFLTMSLAITYLTVKYAFSYIYPFIIAAQLAYLLHPVVTFLENNWRLNRAVATLLIISALFSGFFFFCFIVLKQLITESTHIVNKLPTYIENLTSLFKKFIHTSLPLYDKLVLVFPFLPASSDINVDDYLEDLMEQLSDSSFSLVSTFISSGTYILSSLTYIITVFIFILLFVFIMTKDMKFLIFHFKRIAPVKISSLITAIIIALRKTIWGFIKAQIIIAAISAIIVLIGLLCFQIDHVIIITILIFFIDLIPYFGIGTIFIPWLLSAFFTGQYVLTIQLGALYILLIIFRQIIEPKIIASSIGVHPLIALTVIFIGIQIFGLIGIFIAPILLIILSALYHARIFHLIWDFLKS